nr:uncharacterized protein LOC110439398 [Danio rerio]|eukprot:XP_021331052.1 uncharacterized protein LOC110439398 [Danio rerio]
MTVHLFGAVSSPSCASFALKQTAKDNEGDFPLEVIETINNNFYVDDCLKSVSCEEKAISMAKDLTCLCQKGGFRLTKWISNSREVLQSISQENRAKDIQQLDLDRDKLPVERALGLQWSVDVDTFQFKISLKTQPCTRRGILSVVSSVYDPLGFLAPVILPAKVILQELCRKTLGWDDTIPSTFQRQWTHWIVELDKVAEFQVNRCFKPVDYGLPSHACLHHFADACETGYGTVSYLKMLNGADKVHVSFLMGKSRVTPLKHVTIPRLELTAAVLAVKMDIMLKKMLQLPLEDSVFWSDSTTVLNYIKNENKRFHTFVANRVSFIRDATQPQQWRYVPTKDNPAEDASLGLNVESFLNNERAKRELREALSALNQEKIQRALLQKGVDWSFNPPSSPHFGGVWERLIRLVKQSLCVVLRQQTLDDEALQTVLCEAEEALHCLLVCLKGLIHMPNEDGDKCNIFQTSSGKDGFYSTTWIMGSGKSD